MIMFEEMKTSPYKPGMLAYSMVIEAFGKAGNTKKVGELIDEAYEGDLKPGIMLLNLALRPMLEKNHFQQIRALVEKVQKEYKIKPDALTFNLMIATYAKQQKLELMIKAYEDMTKAGFTPTAVTFKTMWFPLANNHKERPKYEKYFIQEAKKYGIKIVKKPPPGEQPESKKSK